MMDEATQLELVRKAIISRLGGCCEWDEKAAQRVRSDRNLEGLLPEEIKERLQDHVTDHPGSVTARQEHREEYRGVTDFWFRVILPIPGFTHGLFVELVLEDDPDPDVPGVVIVNAHEQRH
jgi:hypothetical protein